MTSPNDSEITIMLQAVRRGDTNAASELLPAVYDQLRRLAQHMMQGEKPGQTLEATALVHEAYMRLAGSAEANFENRRHFFNAAALAMRRTLVDRARRKGRIKHGGGIAREDLDMIQIPASKYFRDEDYEVVHQALEELHAHNPRLVETVHARLFLGLTIPQTAELLDVSSATVKNDYRFALTWLKAKVDISIEDED